jgi:hypothetical protein
MHYALLAFSCFCALAALQYLLDLRKRDNVAQTSEPSEPR